MMKRLLSLLLCIAMLASMLTVTAMAADTTDPNLLFTYNSGKVPFNCVFDCQRNAYRDAEGTDRVGIDADEGEYQKVSGFKYPIHKTGDRDNCIADAYSDVVTNGSSYYYIFEKVDTKVKITLKKTGDDAFSVLMAEEATITGYGENCFLLVTEDAWGYFVGLNGETYNTTTNNNEIFLVERIVESNENPFVPDDDDDTTPTTPTLPTEVRPGESYVLRSGLDRKTVKVDSYDFTTGTRGFNGAAYIDEVKIDKNGDLVLTFKESFTMALEDPKAINGEIILLNKADPQNPIETRVPVTTGLNNVVNEVYGDRDADEAENVNGKWGKNTVMVMDDEGGYVKFSNEMLSGVVKMNADEKTYLNLVYGSHAASAATPNTEDTIDAIEALLGEAYVEEAITEYYTFETRAFKNEVAFSYAAYQDDPHYFYLYKDGKLTAIDVKYNDDEEVEAWQWNAIAEGTIIVTDVEIVLADVEDKNPDTGANDVVGAAAALAVVSLLAAGAVSLKK